MSGTFWKKNTTPIPGQVHRQQDLQNPFKSRTCSFHSYQDSVNDAWEITDDDFKTESKSRGTTNHLRSEHDIQSVSSSQQIRKDIIETHHKSVVSKNTLIKSESGKSAKLQKLLDSASADLADIQCISWPGIPAKLRPNVWRLLTGYVPSCKKRRKEVLLRKRQEYWDLVDQYFETERNGPDQKIYRQIKIDIPRMAPVLNIFQQRSVQETFERILFIWALRHPATSYVQGMNDLVTPFYVVFLQEFLSPGVELNSLEVEDLDKDLRNMVEADSFWCFCKLMDGIQDNYVFAQVGIQEKVNQLRQLIQQVDKDLHKHLEKHDIDYLQFCFRWMNNLLTREVPFSCSVRLWDTYLAEGDNVATFQVYICAAFLLHWKKKLLSEKDFQGLIIFLQNLPTQNWNEGDISVITAEAFRLKFTFADALKHLTNE